MSGGIRAAVSGQVTMLTRNVADPSLPQSRADVACQAAWERLHPQATLQFEPVPLDGFVAIVEKRYRAGRLSDAIDLLPGRTQDAVFPMLEPLHPGDIPSLDELTLWDATLLSPEAPGVYAGVPIGVTGTVMYFNRSLFERAGLDPARTPETWDELADAAARLKAAGIVPIAFAGDQTAFIPWLPLLAQVFSGEDLAAFRRGEIPVTDERFRVTLRALVEAARDGWFDPRFADLQYGDAVAAFGQGRAAMICGWIAGGLNWIEWDEQLGRDAYGLFAVPTLPGVAQQVQFARPNVMIGINRRAANPEGARSWVEFLGSASGLELGLTFGGAMPNRPGIDVGATTGSPHAAAIAELLERLPLADAPIDYLSHEAGNTMFLTLGAAMASGDVDGFLARLDEQHAR